MSSYSLTHLDKPAKKEAESMAIESSSVQGGGHDTLLFQTGEAAAFFAAIRFAMKQCFGSLGRALHKRNVSIDKALERAVSLSETEVDSLKKRFPMITTQYRLLMLRFGKGHFRNSVAPSTQTSMGHAELVVSPFQSFIRSLLQNISRSEEMRSQAYFTSMKYPDHNAFLQDMVLLSMAQNVALPLNASSIVQQSVTHLTPSDSPSGFVQPNRAHPSQIPDGAQEYLPHTQPPLQSEYPGGSSILY